MSDLPGRHDFPHLLRRSSAIGVFEGEREQIRLALAELDLGPPPAIAEHPAAATYQSIADLAAPRRAWSPLVGEARLLLATLDVRRGWLTRRP